jgi:hypothetical protein
MTAGMVCLLHQVTWLQSQLADVMLNAVQGIKIVDAASKKKAREALAAEQELRRMEVESTAGWEEAPPSDLEDME